MQPEKVALEQPTQVEKRTLYLEKLGTTGKWYLPSEVVTAETATQYRTGFLLTNAYIPA